MSCHGLCCGKTQTPVAPARISSRAGSLGPVPRMGPPLLDIAQGNPFPGRTNSISQKGAKGTPRKRVSNIPEPVKVVDGPVILLPGSPHPIQPAARPGSARRSTSSVKRKGRRRTGSLSDGEEEDAEFTSALLAQSNTPRELCEPHREQLFIQIAQHALVKASASDSDPGHHH